MVAVRRLGVALWFCGHPWLSLPFWLAYGVLYGSARTARWHECGHGTAFRHRWMNDAVYQIASFMMMRNPVDLALEPYPPPHRHLHRRPRPRDRHHAPAGVLQAGAQLRSASSTPGTRLGRMLCNATGRHPSAEEADLHPRDASGRKVIRVARIWIAIYAATIALGALPRSRSCR